MLSRHAARRGPIARRGGHMAAAGALVATLAGTLMIMAPATAARADTAPGCGSRDPFTPELAAQLAAAWPGQRFTASVYDGRSGCQYDLHQDLRLTEASVLKVEVMAGILLRAQSQGRPLSAQERSLISPMITASHDAPTTQLWESLGRGPGMSALDNVFGMTGTTQVDPEWGVTVTSARDQVRLLRQVLVGDLGPIGPAYRADAYGYMTGVIPAQRWGISAGLPAGWSFANKNGFAPSNCCPQWRINTTGVVYDPSGRPAYSAAILSDGWPNQPAGVAAVETVSRAVAARLTGWTSQKPAVVTSLVGPAAGSLSAYLVGADGALVTTWQNQAGGTWSPRQTIGGSPPGGGLTGSVTAIMAPAGTYAGTISAYGLARDGRLWTTWQTTAGGLWAGWQPIGGPPPGGGLLGVPSVIPRITGTLSAYALAHDGRLWTTWQTQPGGLWAGWQPIGGPPPGGGALGGPAMVLADRGPYAGIFAAYVRAGDGQLWTTWQTQPGGLWAGWAGIAGTPPPGAIAGSPAAVESPTGAQSIYALGSDDRLYTTWQSQPGGGWAAWTQIG